MPTFGVYPVADAEPAGQEVSSTSEGRHVTLVESELIHPTHSDGFVNKGDPVVFGTAALQGVGVAFKSAAAATDLVAVDTEGIWIIDVNAADDGGNRAIEGGDRLYINVSTAIVSAIATAATQRPFGYALGHIDSGATETIAVKVHWDPIDNMVLDLEEFYFGDSRDCNFVWGPSIINAGVDTLLLTNTAVPVGSSAFQISATAGAGTNDVGVAFYFDANVGGVQTGNWVYGGGLWINLATTFDAPAGSYVIAAQNNGVYAGAVVDYATSTIIYGMKAEIICTAQPANVYAFEIGGNVSGSAITAIFRAAQPAICGYALGHLSGVACGHLALIMVNGSGTATPMYVNLWAS